VKSIDIQYYAILREKSGLSHETLQTSASTATQLYQELQKRFGFSLPINVVKVAINNEFAAWNTEIRPGDKVAFIPPVAGG